MEADRTITGLYAELNRLWYQETGGDAEADYNDEQIDRLRFGICALKPRNAAEALLLLSVLTEFAERPERSPASIASERIAARNLAAYLETLSGVSLSSLVDKDAPLLSA